MKNVTIETHSGPAVLLQNVKNIDIAGLSFTENSAPPVKILGSFTENIRLRKTDFSDPVRQVHVMPGLDREAIQMEN
jgi:hypothetical protein